jgi:2-polyprenyl-3-methyl-5-hydroxy-6-metoxy-1,4-benzoquinol methylase
MTRRPRETNPARLREAATRRLPRRMSAQGQVRLPAVPALLDDYLRRLSVIFSAVGRAFDAGEMDELRSALEPQLRKGFEASPFAHVLVKYQTEEPPEVSLSYWITVEISTIEDEYQEWVQDRTPPLFGAHPDAKVMALAASLGAPAAVRVLDVGAGTGRNALPLARAGHPVDAVELAVPLAELLRKEVRDAGVAARVFQGDILDRSLGVPERHYRLVVLAEVIASHTRTVRDLRGWFERLSELLSPGGLLVLSAFVGAEGYGPDPMIRELSQVFWCCLFSRREIKEASAGLWLEPVSDESVHDYEKTHLPPEAWPPTGWFEDWSRGRDLFDLPAEASPCELRWLVYRKKASAP